MLLLFLRGPAWNTPPLIVKLLFELVELGEEVLLGPTINSASVDDDFELLHFLITIAHSIVFSVEDSLGF